MKGKSLPITGTGEETRDFTYVLDLVQGLIKASYYKEAVKKTLTWHQEKKSQ